MFRVFSSFEMKNSFKLSISAEIKSSVLHASHPNYLGNQESEESCFFDIHTCLRNYFSLAMQSETWANTHLVLRVRNHFREISLRNLTAVVSMAVTNSLPHFTYRDQEAGKLSSFHMA